VTAVSARFIAAVSAEVCVVSCVLVLRDHLDKSGVDVYYLIS